MDLRPLRALKHPKSGRVCKYPDCGKPHSGKGLCIGHYHQHASGKPLTDLKPRNEVGEGYVDEDGYRWITKGGRKRSEHCWVMEEALDRELLPHETVHHKNGQRLDNRLENLELWSSSHPSGQRVVDKVHWAVYMIRLYQPELLVD